jgi:FlaA1/EpsC-like NDP-sugar epimerase
MTWRIDWKKSLKRHRGNQKQVIQDFEHLATGRKASCFTEAIEQKRPALRGLISGRRIAIIGAAGSIGFSVVKSLLEFHPGAMVLIDLSENNLVEVVRELRSSEGLAVPDDFAALPIGLGSVECTRFLKESKPFDYILNLSAIKHVRSEKDVYCLARMMDTNVLFLHDMLECLPYGPRKFFSVSSDKATNPANLMGASKMVMEEMLRCQERPFSTARFANVAFSDGSLPHGFLKRIEKYQPISAPKDVKRYFMSHEEAGQICLLSCALGEYADVFFPKLEAGVNERTFSDIAVRLLAQLGYEAVPCASEDEAKAKATDLIPRKKWPCYFFETDTTGEKAFEEFYAQGDTLDCSSLRNIGIVKRNKADVATVEAVRGFIAFARAAKSDPKVTKADYVREVAKIVPGFDHVEKNKNLDQKM